MDLLAPILISLSLVLSVCGELQTGESPGWISKTLPDYQGVRECRPADDSGDAYGKKILERFCLPSGLQRFSCSAGEECCQAPPRSVPPFRCQALRKEYDLPQVNSDTVYIQSKEFELTGSHTQCIGVRDVVSRPFGGHTIFGLEVTGLTLSLNGPVNVGARVGSFIYFFNRYLQYQSFFEEEETYMDNHLHCVVHDVDAKILIYYVDVTEPGVMEEVGRSDPFDVSLPVTASVSPFRLSSSNLFDNGGGKVNYLEVWDWAMTIEELNSLVCKDTGNLLSWTDPDAFEVVGDPDVSDAPCPFSV
jgi:hypothetical protein